MKHNDPWSNPNSYSHKDAPFYWTKPGLFASLKEARSTIVIWSVLSAMIGGMVWGIILIAQMPH